MLFEGKRGLSKRELPQIILALVVVLVVFPYLIRTTDIAAATLDVEKCRLNTMLASFDAGIDMKLFRLDAPNPFYLDCPKRYAYVSNDNIKVDNVNTKLAEKDNREKRERQLKDFILSEMTKCWKSFGAASDTVYSASTGQGEAEMNTDETACFSCSEVFFDKDFDQATITDKDFYDYANSKSMIIEEQSYVAFLTGGNAPPELPAEFGAEKEIKLDENQQWSTVFTIKKMPVGYFDEKIRKIRLPWQEKKVYVPPANSGIVDCSVVGEDGKLEKIHSLLANAIGCKATNPPTINGFVFGKVSRGYYTFFDKRVDWDTGNTVRFPMTVRFIPTEDVFKGDGGCKRLY